MASAAVACIQASGLFPSASHPFWQLTVDAVTSRCAGPSPAPVVESSSSSSEEEDETGPPSDSATPTNPLAALPDAQAMADYLVSELAEQPALGEKFRKSAEILGPDKLWELLLLTGQKIRDNDPIMIDQKGKKRTGGGVFLQLLKPVEAQLKRKREVPQENPGSQRPRLALRPYQAEAVKAIESQRPEKRNWVVAAPTNSGKTAIFVTVARNLLAKKPAAKVVVVVPTLALLDQQSRAFESNGGFRMAQDSKFRSAGLPVVDWFCGDKPFPPSSGPHSAWDDELEHLSVLVFEANTFLNLLKRDASGHVRARMADVDLLVLDECHHCSKEHPYAGIMGYYFASPKKPQV
ncbi:P-loop containing nucleoside triphosphate hydrolase protein [Dunaliella salina]|uniref:P-loop containing nucleoside triphosphate hydrolase protein n=1 Tax=Dunaliella salina TaxID=3046 RepID=A0ABQ7GMW0_DUNSA|nr:P-loop containing nucleoside triphosphate hydrolase protein [Dunaliella salina]|eukprot:KAF5835945.1 P-loop containing nucleoside triphosphate hydrolase protein [Dunaliella salina]